MLPSQFDSSIASSLLLEPTPLAVHAVKFNNLWTRFFLNEETCLS